MREPSSLEGTGGDRAGAELLDAYRALVREEVARHAGAEIRTEGDSFYLVFPPARRAVACGMALVAAADAHSREHRGSQALFDWWLEHGRFHPQWTR